MCWQHEDQFKLQLTLNWASRGGAVLSCNPKGQYTSVVIRRSTIGCSGHLRTWLNKPHGHGLCWGQLNLLWRQVPDVELLGQLELVLLPVHCRGWTFAIQVSGLGVSCWRFWNLG